MENNGSRKRLKTLVGRGIAVTNQIWYYQHLTAFIKVKQLGSGRQYCLVVKIMSLGVNQTRVES